MEVILVSFSTNISRGDVIELAVNVVLYFFLIHRDAVCGALVNVTRTLWKQDRCGSENLMSTQNGVEIRSFANMSCQLIHCLLIRRIFRTLSNRILLF